ncbi:ribosomal RNA small subunit methyltransferase A [Candidatus Uhrbacteria bacterium]|nr:ribosomal RNA small subunit methyltransferase A [Candidatus Uhrbacteria bacterium]
MLEIHINPTSLENIKELCEQYGITPRRERGQNFLIDPKVLGDVVDAAALSNTDTVLEIGPGFGVLTEQLSPRAKEVIAVELDQKLVSALQKKFCDQKNVTIIQDDILAWLENKYFEISKSRNVKVVANIPYQITSRLLRIFLERPDRPSLLVLMVQKEVAERIVALPGAMSMLSVMVQYYGVPEIVRVVPRSSFWPEPAVDSAIVRIKPHPRPLLSGEGAISFSSQEKGPWRAELAQAQGGMRFFRIVKMGFASRRKQLQNNLAAGLHLPKEEVQTVLERVGFDQKVRAQELSIDDWKKVIHGFGV